jgi:hypothetical protein
MEDDAWRFDENPQDHEAYDSAGVGRRGSSGLAPKTSETGETKMTTQVGSKKKKGRPSFVTGKFRVSFPNLLQPRAAQPGQTPMYSLVMIFPDRASIKQLESEAIAAAGEEWGQDQAKWPKNIQWPFRKGEEKAELGYPAGSIFINAKSKNKPGTVDENVQPVIAEGVVYGGCYGRATVAAYAWSYMGKNGVSFGLRNFQKWGDGEPFSGSRNASDDFDAIPVENGNGTAQAAAAPAAAGGINLGI